MHLTLPKALLIAHLRASERFASILNSVRGVIFVGTPHRGGNGVDSATFVSNFLKAVNITVRVDLIQSLNPNSMVLFDLTDDFRQLVDAKGMGISTLFEVRKTVFGHWPVKRQFLVRNMLSSSTQTRLSD